MDNNIKEMLQYVRGGGLISFDQALNLATASDSLQLFAAADQLRRHYHNNELDLCSIVNARSGKCSEDCKFCAQSSHHQADIDVYEAAEDDFIKKLAHRNDEAGVSRFSLVTAGRSISGEKIGSYKDLLEELQQSTNLSFCASMGMLTREKAEQLKSLGVERYHCNLEGSRNFFPKICTTHTWEEKVETIKCAQAAGLEVCSGGIIGMGETLENRLELAFELRDLGILSIPINILSPIPNTPLADVEPIGLGDVLTCLAMFRFINPQAIIRLAGGRGRFEGDQSKFFTAGANGAIVGDYLTTSGNNIEQDLEMFTALGFDMSSFNREQSK